MISVQRKVVSFISATLLTLVLFLSLSFVHAKADTSIYRLYHTGTGEHLYTSDANEAQTLGTRGWRSEGTAWIAPDSGQGVYRLYNSSIDDHLYTIDTNEKNVLSGQGWSIDNGNKPLFYSGGGTDIFRLYNNGSKRHLLTTDGHEYSVLPTSGWQQEGSKLKGLRLGSNLAGPRDISNTPAAYAIETDMTVSGGGQGYHAKILAQTPQSAVSFGLQFDTGGLDSYRNNTGFIIENVLSNAPGQQQYLRPGLGASNQTYRVLMTVGGDGTCTFYVNGIPFGPSVKNPNLAGQGIDMSVEGSGKQNGDVVNASFSNIKVKNSNTYDANKYWKATVRDTNASIHSDASKFDTEKRITISGTVNGLGAGQDWDNAYDKVSGITTFYDH